MDVSAGSTGKRDLCWTVNSESGPTRCGSMVMPERGDWRPQNAASMMGSWYPRPPPKAPDWLNEISPGTEQGNIP